MEMLMCEKCKSLLGYNEVVLRKEFWSETESFWNESCPHCGGDVTGAIFCEYCEEWVPENEMIDGIICKKCFGEYATPENLMAYTAAEDLREDIEIDRGAISVLSAVGISINDIAVSIANDVINDSRYSVRLNEMTEDVITKEFILEDFLEKMKEMRVKI